MTSPVIGDEDILDGLSVWFLKMTGLWRVINHYRVTGKRNRIIKFKLFVTLLLNLPYIISQYLAFFFIKVDIQKTTFLNLHSVPCLQIVARFMVFWFRVDSVTEFYSLVRKDFLTCVPESKREAVRDMNRKISWKANMLYNSTIICNLSVAALWIAVPGISVEYIAHRTGNMADVKGGKKKILGGWYPLPITESPYYEVIFYMEIILQLWDSVMLSVYAGIFFLPLVCLHAQFSALGHHLSTLTAEDSNVGGPAEDSPIYRQLYQIIGEHLKLIKYISKFSLLYNML